MLEIFIIVFFFCAVIADAKVKFIEKSSKVLFYYHYLVLCAFQQVFMEMHPTQLSGAKRFPKS